MRWVFFVHPPDFRRPRGVFSAPVAWSSLLDQREQLNQVLASRWNRSGAYQRNDFCSPRSREPSHKVARQAVTSPKLLYSSPTRLTAVQ